MKKLTFFAAAATLLLASCSDDISRDVSAPGQEVEVTFSTALPAQMLSRATNVSDGTTADRLNYTVFIGSTVVKSGVVSNAFQTTTREETLSLPLITGETYTITFWADKTGSPYSYTDGVVKINDYSKVNANDEEADAFFYTLEDYKVTGPATKTVYLTRPFAQINFGTTKADYEAALLSSLDVTQSSVGVGVDTYSTLNLVDGTVSDQVAADITYAMADTPTDTDNPFKLTNDNRAALTVEGTDYVYVGYAYVLTADAQSLVSEVTLTPKSAGKTIRSYTNVPIQRNYRTNIIGNLFTSAVDFKVIIDQNYNDPDTNLEYVVYNDVSYLVDRTAWDGTTVTAPYSATIDGKNYLIVGSAAQLAGLSEMVNNYNNSRASSLGNYNKEKVVILIDIDLNNQEWTPIGHSKTGNDNYYGFHGDFDGLGNTISNLTITKKNAYGFAGLFGNIGSNTMENLVIENVNIDVSIDSGDEVVGTGAFAGSAIPGCTVQNITVRNANIKANRMAGGVVGHGYVSIKNCTVDNAEITVVPNLKSTKYDNGDKIGGLCGQIAEEAYVVTGNRLNNITLTGFRDMGGILGHLNSTRATFKNNTITNSIIRVQDQENYDGHTAGENVDKIIGRLNSGVSIDASNSESNVIVKFEAVTTLANGVVTCTTPVLPSGVTVSELANKAGVLVDTDGTQTILENTAAAVQEAILKGGTLYFAPNADIALSKNHITVSENGITVYGNGAKFGTTNTDGTVAAERDFSVQYGASSGYYDYPAGSVVNIQLYDLNNARVWGANTSDVDYTVNVLMDNCTYVTSATSGNGPIMLRSNDEKLGDRNVTLTNCYFSGGLPTVHITHGGSLTVDNCTFKGAGIPINIAHKKIGTMDVKITNCTFDGCGCTKDMSTAYNYAAAVRIVQNERDSEAVKTTLTLYDCTFTNRVGNWDILLRDYRSGKTSFPIDIITLDVDSSVKVAKIDPNTTSESEMFGS